MLWKLVTDAVVAVHGLWLAAVILGPALAWRNPKVRLVHLIMLWWAFFVVGSGIYCPVSGLENTLRAHYDPSSTYSSSFIVHYIGPMMSWDLTRPRILAGMAFWTILWTVLY